MTLEHPLFAPAEPLTIGAEHGNWLSLPDGDLLWWPGFLGAPQASALQQRLQAEIAWRHEQIRLFGRWHWQPRLIAWFGARDYRYSGLTLQAQDLPACLLPIQQACEQATGSPFNSLLLNRYRDGQDGMGWHADDEAELGENPVIASLSLGQSRRFVLRHRQSGEKREFLLQHGDLLVMAGAMQHHWQHALPKTQRVCAERINLTFRYLY